MERLSAWAARAHPWLTISRVIDLHCHILPGIDDGPATMEESLALVRAAAANGIKAIVATPHASWDYPMTSAAVVESAVTGLMAALARQGIVLPVFRGAEIDLTRALRLPDEELHALRIGGRNGTYVLVECPLAPTVPGLEQQFVRLEERGHRILLAHPERCPTFQRHPDIYERLVGRGMLGQVTAGSVAGRFGRTVQAYAVDLVVGGFVHVIASDAHSADRRRPSLLDELVEAGFEPQARWLTQEVPWAILTGKELPPAPAWLAPSRRSTPSGRRGGRLRRA